MPTGTVKKLPNVKNYAFVVVEGEPGEEIFLHRTAVADDGFDQLRHGQRVRFEVGPDPRDTKKRAAREVTPAE